MDQIAVGVGLAVSPSTPRADDLADRVAAAVRNVPGVADLHTGAFGEVATHLPGRRVGGVQIRADHCAVHVVRPVLECPLLARLPNPDVRAATGSVST